LHGRAESILNELVPVETRVVAMASAEADGVLYPEKIVSAIVRGILPPKAALPPRARL
jgi:hypothetical protein